MAWLYALAFLSWGAVLLYMAPSVWRMYVKQHHRNDPARLHALLVAALMMGFLGRRLFHGDFASDAAMVGLLLADIAVAAFTLHLGHSYGRGRRA